MLEKQNLFQQYLKQNNITFEDYEKWFKSLKVGDSTCRYDCFPDDMSKIVEISEVGIRFEGITSQNVFVFYNLDLTKKTVCLRFSNRIIEDPANFPTLSEIDLTELKKSSISKDLSVPSLISVSEHQIYDALSVKFSEEKEGEMSGRHPKPALPQKDNEEKKKKLSFKSTWRKTT